MNYKVLYMVLLLVALLSSCVSWSEIQTWDCDELKHQQEYRHYKDSIHNEWKSIPLHYPQ